MIKCRACGEPLAPEAFRCASCKAWTWETAVENVNLTDVVFFEDIDEQEILRISLGPLDECLGGGIVASDVVLIGGGPGAGKSTILLQICSYIWKHGVCLYVASEEDIRTIKRRGHRLGIKPTARQLAFAKAMGGNSDIGSILATIRPAGFIIDSLNGLVGHDLNAEVRALDIIKKYCVLLGAPAIVVSQVNAGEDFSGLKAKQHAVDVLLTLSKDEDIRTDGIEPMRVLETIKNRSGKAGVETFLEMTETGLKVLSGKRIEKLLKE
jgi:DNA repair protein RadA/Sms